MKLLDAYEKLESTQQHDRSLWIPRFLFSGLGFVVAAIGGYSLLLAPPPAPQSIGSVFAVIGGLVIAAFACAYDE